jgi:K+-sensing histidine kinase KdpD
MNKKGHGLGLFNCKRIALGLKGDLILNNEVHNHIEFVLSLPVEVIEPKPKETISKFFLSIEAFLLFACVKN